MIPLLLTLVPLKATTDKSICWVPKARWVVDGNIWSSSGVSAGTSFPHILRASLDENPTTLGTDMAYAFLKFLAGKELAESRRITLEWREAAQDDDEFAKYYGLC